LKAVIYPALGILAGTLFLMLDAFFNGFPIVYSDTSTYIAAGFELQTPIDRPMSYGLFIRIFSINGLSLWLVVFSQALILSYLIIQLIRQFSTERTYLIYGLAIIAILSIFTSVSWTVSQLMPDIFTATAFLSALLIMIGKYKRRTLIFLFFLYFLSVIMHMSHPILFALLLILVYILKKYFKTGQDFAISNKYLAIIFSLTILSVFTMSSAMTKSKHVFMMGSMAEKGILKKYLDDKCETNGYKLCAFKEVLPQTFNDFVWKENSPLYKLGGWRATKAEFNEIINGTLTQPKYIALHVTESIKATFNQLIRFKIGDGNGSFNEGTALYGRVSKFFPHDLNAYRSSRQNQSTSAYLIYINSVFTFVTLASFLFILFIINKKAYDSRFKFMVMMIILLVLINAWDCGTFSIVADRFGSKISWLIPMLALLSGLQAIQNKKYNRKTIKGKFTETPNK
jgi:hypothetical protein